MFEFNFFPPPVLCHSLLIGQWHQPVKIPGMCSRTGWSRPCECARPGIFEAKARGLHGQGHKILSSRSRPVLEHPHPCAFYSVMLHRERLCHIVCLSITFKFNASCACVWSIVFMVLSPLLINHTQKFNVLRPYLEAKAKAAHRQGHGQRSSRPRPQNFVLEVSSRSRPVLEDPIPEKFLSHLSPQVAFKMFGHPS